MTKAIIYTITIFSVLNASVVQAGIFGGNNYDECIVESMKGVKSDVAARSIIRSCREKFPDRDELKRKSRNLSSSELKKLTGRAGLVLGNYYSGNLYNGLKNLTITELTVAVSTKMDGKEITKEYIGEVTSVPTFYRINSTGYA